MIFLEDVDVLPYLKFSIHFRAISFQIIKIYTLNKYSLKTDLQKYKISLDIILNLVIITLSHLLHSLQTK